jgi:hypothetical protein
MEFAQLMWPTELDFPLGFPEKSRAFEVSPQTPHPPN